MRRRRKPLIKRTISGTLACLLTAVSVLSASSAVPAMASESEVKMSYKQEKLEKIGIYVESENETFGAGENMLLNVYIQNNSGEPLTDGTLKWYDKKETLSRGGFVYDSEYDEINANEATPDSAEKEIAEETTTAVQSFPEETASAENASVEGETEPSGPSFDVAETTVAAGPASDDDGFGNSWEDDWYEDDEADETIEGPYLDSEGNLRNIDLAPGEIFEVQFSGTIDDDISGLRNREIRFSFGARKENGRRLSNNFKYQFNTGLMTMLPVDFIDGNQVEANEEHTMTLHLGLDDIEYMFEEIESDKSETMGTPSDAAKATPSDAEKTFIPAEIIQDEADATEATPSEADEATPSQATEADDDEEDSEDVFNPEDVKYTIETYGVRLKGVKARFDEEASGSAESVTEVSYRVASGTEPGLYFGKVTASVKFNGNTYKTVQGFHINVTGEGQMVLKGMYKDSEIVVSGPAESFPDGEILSLKISEITEEQRVMLEEALKKMAEETGTAVEAMVPMDIKVIADGEERELNGPVSVTFSNMELENTDSAEEEKSLIEKARALLGEEEEKDVDGVIDVWHLDEDAVALDKLDSSVTEDGNVVMTTDHFSVKVLTLSRAAATAAAREDDKTVVTGKGIKFKLFNYSPDINKDENGKFRSISPYFSFRGAAYGSTTDSAEGFDVDGFPNNHATVERKLSYKNGVGYPVLDLSRLANGNPRENVPTIDKEIRSLGYLFGAESDKEVTEYTPKNTILQNKEDNRYYYNSAENAVDYDFREDADGNKINEFRVRNYVERNETTGTSYGTNYGDFLPFNYTNGNEISETNYHVTTANTDYWFGMTMEVEFYQTKDGLIDSAGNPMKFEFSGDDDVWVFIDDVLVLDLGGTHGTVSGSIDFSNGTILQYLDWGDSNPNLTDKTQGSDTSFPTTLKACFDAADNAKPNGGWKKDVAGNDTGIFADYSKHTLKFFYMERGSAVANCKLDFRLPTLPDESLTVGKELVVPDDAIALKEYLTKKMDYTFRVVKADAPNEPYLTKGTEYILLDGDTQIKKTIENEDGSFTLKAGQKAQFEKMVAKGNGIVNYIVQEQLPKDLAGTYSDVAYKVGGNGGTVQTGTDSLEKFKLFSTNMLSAYESQIVIFENIVDSEQLVNVKVEKVWDDGEGCDSRSDSVTVRLYADGEPFSAEASELTLNEDNHWRGTFENLPKFNTDNTNPQPIFYTVKEINKNYQVAEGDEPTDVAIDQNGTFYGNENKEYKVTYRYKENLEEGCVADVVVTNTHRHSIDIKKSWSDGNAEHAEDPVLVGLYKDDKPVASKFGVQLLDYEESDHTITGSFADLIPASYTVKELVEVSADAPEAEKEFQYDSKYYKGLGDESRLGDFYKVTYDPLSGSTADCESTVKITNTLSKATIKIGKWIDNYDAKLAGEQFIVNVNVASGEIKTGLVLAHDTLSKGIEVYAGDGRVKVSISEIVPKEYEFVGITEGRDAENEPELIASNGTEIEVSVTAGEEVVLWVHNSFGHRNYFHNSDDEMNDFNPARKLDSANVETEAIVPERKEWERLLSEAENM